MNHDGHDDLLIAAPGASPASRAGAGKVYLVYGSPSFSPGVVELAAVGVSRPGHVFHGESAGDRAGESISSWPDVGSAVDDLIIGAPYASPDGRPGAGESYVVFGSDQASPRPSTLRPTPT